MTVDGLRAKNAPSSEKQVSARGPPPLATTRPPRGSRRAAVPRSTHGATQDPADGHARAPPNKAARVGVSVGGKAAIQCARVPHAEHGPQA